MSNTDELALALKLAVCDPEKRNFFYNKLSNSAIYLISDNKGLPLGETIVSEETSISIVQIKDQQNQVVTPFFSSPEHISQLMDNVINYIKIDMQVFLSITNCAPCILNPGSEYSKEFTTEELLALLDGSLLNSTSQYVAKAGSKMLIGQPEVEPIELLQILKEIFNKYQIVSEGYVAKIALEDDAIDLHFLVAVKANGSLDTIFQDVSHLIEKKLDKKLIVDFIDLSNSKEICAYFQDIEPFYKNESNLAMDIQQDFHQ